MFVKLFLIYSLSINFTVLYISIKIVLLINKFIENIYFFCFKFIYLNYINCFNKNKNLFYFNNELIII